MSLSNIGTRFEIEEERGPFDSINSIAQMLFISSMLKIGKSRAVESEVRM